jgi:DNA-binding GntR family transcriptional regulator
MPVRPEAGEDPGGTCAGIERVDSDRVDSDRVSSDWMGSNRAASDRVVRELRRAILESRLPPGSRLRQEELAGWLGTSRVPVREALRTLAAEGLVEMEANRGAWVPWRSAEEVDLLYQMRERLEPLALAVSVPRLRAADLERLVCLQERIREWPGVEEFLRLDRELHLAIYAGCTMEPLAGTVLRLWNATQHYRRLYMALSGPRRHWVVNAEHDLLLDALGRRDAEDAGRLLEGHIRRTRIELARHPEVFDRGGPTN